MLKEELQIMENDFTCIVERTLVLHDSETGQKGEIRLAIGQPYWTDPGMEAACPVAIYGYFGRLPDIRGIDPMSALSLAIKFLESLLEGLPETRKVLWPSGESYFDV
jgi:hypothetical protein